MWESGEVELGVLVALMLMGIGNWVLHRKSAKSNASLWNSDNEDDDLLHGTLSLIPMRSPTPRRSWLNLFEAEKVERESPAVLLRGPWFTKPRTVPLLACGPGTFHGLPNS